MIDFSKPVVIAELSVAERIILVQNLWDSIEAPVADLLDGPSTVSIGQPSHGRPRVVDPAAVSASLEGLGKGGLDIDHGIGIRRLQWYPLLELRPIDRLRQGTDDGRGGVIAGMIGAAGVAQYVVPVEQLSLQLAVGE